MRISLSLLFLGIVTFTLLNTTACGEPDQLQTYRDCPREERSLHVRSKESLSLPQYIDNDEGEVARNAIFGELAGKGILLSLNYERFIPGNFGARFRVIAAYGSDEKKWKTDATPQSDFIFESESCPENAAFGELGGNGLILSINYERFFSRRFGFRVGYGIVGGAIPLMVNWYVGSKYQLELGAGVAFNPSWKTLSLTEESKGPLLLTSTVGFKFDAPPCGGFFVRASLTPFFNPENVRGRLIVGLSLGSTF